MVRSDGLLGREGSNDLVLLIDLGRRPEFDLGGDCILAASRALKRQFDVPWCPNLFMAATPKLALWRPRPLYWVASNGRSPARK